jgi:hypothetical protein
MIIFQQPKVLNPKKFAYLKAVPTHELLTLVGLKYGHENPRGSEYERVTKVVKYHTTPETLFTAA